MTTTTTALTVKQKTFKDLIEKAKGSIADILPKHIDPDRMAKTMLLAMTRQPLLYECSAESILQAFMTCSELGLEPGGIRGYMYLIPFWNNRNKGYECQTIPGYRGLMQLARNSGELSHISAHVVHANDKFKVVYGLHEDLVHEPCIDENPGVPMGVYAVAHMKSGEHQFEVMTKAEVEGIRDRSKSRDKSGNVVGPWVTDTLEMWRKTAIRRLAKYLELSEQMERALDLDDAQYERVRGLEKASVDMAGMLNAPQERGVVIDLDQIHPAEPVPIPVDEPKEVDEWGETPPWEDPVPDPEPPPETAKRGAKAKPQEQEQLDTVNSIIADLQNLCGPAVNRASLETYLGLPLSKWTTSINQALEVAIQRLSKGETPEQVFPEIFSH